MKIILMGYMASGKSTVGSKLADKISLPFIDLDNYIEKKEGNTISEIFREKGEIYFRLQEHNYLKELLLYREDFVLALGGGTPCYAQNMSLILAAKKTISFYLKVSIKTIVNRLKLQENKRPLVDVSDEKLTEFVAKHLFERTIFYEKATYKLIIDHKNIEEIMTTIIKLGLPLFRYTQNT